MVHATPVQGPAKKDFSKDKEALQKQKLKTSKYDQDARLKGIKQKHKQRARELAAKHKMKMQELEKKHQQKMAGKDGRDPKVGHQELLGIKSKLLLSAYINIGDQSNPSDLRNRLDVPTQYASVDHRLKSTIQEYMDSLGANSDKQVAFVSMLKDVFGKENIAPFLPKPLKLFIKEYNNFVKDYRQQYGKDPVFNPTSKKGKRFKKHKGQLNLFPTNKNKPGAATTSTPAPKPPIVPNPTP